MRENRYDELAADLVTLGREVRLEEPSPGLAVAVLARVADLPVPAEPEPIPQLLREWRGALVVGRRRAAAVVVAVLVALLLTPPVRAAVVDWFGFGGVLVKTGSGTGATSAAPPPTVGPAHSLDEAVNLVGFDPLVPAALGAPDGVEVSADHTMLSMSWSEDDGPVRLDQFDGRLDFRIAKTAPDVRYAAVAGSDALWFDRPHEVVVLAPDGSQRIETARLAGTTLIWERAGVTLRLEGDLSLTEAVVIAESVEPVD